VRIGIKVFAFAIAGLHLATLLAVLALYRKSRLFVNTPRFDVTDGGLLAVGVHNWASARHAEDGHALRRTIVDEDAGKAMVYISLGHGTGGQPVTLVCLAKAFPNHC
jgi:hypothetical protein